MNRADKLEQWRPCRHMCELAGAVSFFMSIEDCAVIINGPRWCAMFAEREVSAYTQRKSEHLYCSEITEFDLLYGVEDKLLNLMDEIRSKNEFSLVVVLNSCSMSLIGDDVAGICKSADLQYRVIALDANGFGGDFWTGYNKAAEKLLTVLPMQSNDTCKQRVNLLGISSNYPNWKADLNELKRWLQVGGLEIGICLGEDGLLWDDFADLSKAALNVVIQPELGTSMAEKIRQISGQPYIVANIPYGLKSSEKWLCQIAAALNCGINQTAVGAEIEEIQNEIKSVLLHQSDMHDTPATFSQVLVAAPWGIAKGLVGALRSEIFDCGPIYLKINGPSVDQAEAIEGVQDWKSRPILPPLADGANYCLLFGSEFERYECGLYHRTVYKGVCMPTTPNCSHNRPFAGPIGWSILFSSIFEDLHSLVKVTASGKW